MKKEKKKKISTFSLSRIWRLKFSTNDIRIYHLSVRFSWRSFVKNPFRLFHTLCFVLFLNSVLFSKNTHINHAMQLWTRMNASQCRDPTALNRALGMSTFSMLRSRDVGLISLFTFSTSWRCTWDQVRIASVLLFLWFFSFLISIPCFYLIDVIPSYVDLFFLVLIWLFRLG